MSAGLRADSITPATPSWKLEAPPPEKHAVLRPRITTKIERHVGKDRGRGDVLLVSAPAGYGKTTALAQWASETDLPVMWYHLDASDNDPQAFIFGLVRALRTRLPRGHWQVKSLLGRVRGDTMSPLDTRRAGEVLIEDIQRHVNRPMALVVTGVAEIDRRGVVATLLDHLLLRPADHLRLLLECREAPELRLSPLLAQQRLEGIGMEDLRFTDEELGALLTQSGIEQSEDELHGLQELCDGWVTGALLATGALWRTCLGAHMSEMLNREAVFGYLACEVIDRLPQALRDFATRASALGYLTASLCSRLLDEEPRATQQLLASLARTTGFLTPAGRRNGEPVYRFQPLLGQALLERLTGSLDDARALSALRSRAGGILEDQGDAEEAARQYAAAGDYDALLSLIEQQRSGLTRAGYGVTLARWIDLLPAHMRREHADLDVLLAELHRLAGRTSEALAIVSAICDAPDLDERRVAPTLVARAHIVRADVLYSRGDYAAAQRDCMVALSCAPDDHDELHIKARFLMAASVSAVDGPRKARPWLDGVEARCGHLGDLWALGRLKYVRSNLALAEGAYAEAEREAASGLLFAQEASDEIRAFMCLLNLGAIRQYLGQLALARENLESALSLAKSAGHTQGVAYALANLGDLEFSVGDYSSAVARYEQALTVEKRVNDQRLRACAIAGLGYALALSGQVDVARYRVERALVSLTAEQDGQDWAILMVALGFVSHQHGDLAAAERALRDVLQRASDRGMTAEVARAQLTLSAVLLGGGQVAGALDALGAALALAAEADGTHTPLLDARYLPTLWPLLGEVDHPLARALLDVVSPRLAREAIRASSARSVAEARAPLRVYAFGDNGVFLGDDKVTTWARPGMRETLVYLLDRETPARREEILTDLWPDKDPRLANEEFRKVRSELKKALGVQIAKVGDGRFAIASDCWLDVREFKRLASEGHSAAQAGEHERAATALRKAAEVGSGIYLTDTYSEWATLRRDALRREYLSVLEHLLDAEMALKRYKALTRTAYLLLDADPFCEKAHRALMVGFYASGEPARALDQFRRCALILRRELNMEPTAATVALYRTIRQRTASQEPRAAQAAGRSI
ncbi:MAG TPA: BTAD domain-containing putative transcriptional regulator [Ktedonobacterales bacterium]